jgi:diguanylate cyclase (GGDEF)-like protein
VIPFAHIQAAWSRGLIVLIALVCTIHLTAQRYSFREYESTEGLNNPSVNCVLQDRTGYIWVGTDNGLFRYDGKSFLEFSHAQGLPSSEITALAESAQGVLWVGTQAGAATLVGDKFSSVETGEQGGVEAIAFDRLGQIYLERVSGIVRGVPTGSGAYRFGTVARGDIKGLLVRGINVWFCRDGDVWHLRGTESERIGSPAGLPVDRWVALAQDSLGNLWARSSTHLYQLPQGQTRFVDRSKGIPFVSGISHLYTDQHEGVFISTNAGMVILRGTSRELVDSLHGLSTNAVGPVFLDRDESLWIGTYGGGLLRGLGHGEWVSWKKEDGLLNNSIWSIVHDHIGHLWVGTGGGLSIFGPDGKLTRSWTSHNGLAGDRVLALTVAPNSDILAGTDPTGISRFNSQGALLRTYGRSSGLIGDRVNALAIDSQERLWVMTNKGCLRSLKPVGVATQITFEPVHIPGIPPGTSMRDVTQRPDGVLWVATANGLARFDGGKWRVFTQADGLRAGDVGAIIPNHTNHEEIWISYRDALGMARIRFHDEKIEIHPITTADGLSSDLIYAIAFDREGRLWATSDNGADVLEHGRWSRYTKEDGLVWDDGNTHALTMDAEGGMWIGTSMGLSRFRPRPYLFPKLPPRVVLTSIEGISQKWSADDHPVLPHERGSLLIGFSALNFTYETRTLFRYRLLGYDTGWQVTRENSIHYVGLPSGRYVFEVVAAEPDGLWSPVPTRFAFSVKAAWWQSWWIALAILVVALLLARAVLRFRVRALMARQAALEKEVASRTAELRESHRQLEEFAYCDVLTSLPNRRMFSEQFRAQLALAHRHAESFALLLIDLDHFKQVNDTFGHDAGDAVLIETGVRLREAVRESDSIARIGGDEFAVLLVSAEDLPGVQAVCRRIVEGFASPILFNGVHMQASCSVGIAMFPDDGDSQESLYKAADMSLYEAKRMGRRAYSA